MIVDLLLGIFIVSPILVLLPYYLSLTLAIPIFGVITFKNKRKNANLIKFNILKDKVKKLENFKNISHVIIASGGEKKLDDVEKNYKYEKEVGYNKIKEILDLTIPELPKKMELKLPNMSKIKMPKKDKLKIVK